MQGINFNGLKTAEARNAFNNLPEEIQGLIFKMMPWQDKVYSAIAGTNIPEEVVEYAIETVTNSSIADNQNFSDDDYITYCMGYVKGWMKGNNFEPKELSTDPKKIMNPRQDPYGYKPKAAAKRKAPKNIRRKKK